jgi:hypothetical protein
MVMRNMMSDRSESKNEKKVIKRIWNEGVERSEYEFGLNE